MTSLTKRDGYFLVDYAQWTLVYFERIRVGCRA